MTRINSTLHVFSKIGLVMLFYLSVLVRDGSLFSKSAFFHYQNMQEPVHALDESMYKDFSNQNIFFYHFFCVS